MRTGWIIFWAAVGIITLPIVGIALNTYFGTLDVVGDEIDPHVVQQKYEWFKEQRAAIDKTNASLQAHKATLEQMRADHGNKTKDEWPRDERQAYNDQVQVVNGYVATYNNLASEYNAEMAKWNWRFANAGGLPQGATEVLPRDFVAYKYEA